MPRRVFPIQWMTALAIVGLMLVLASLLLWQGARGTDRLLLHAMEDTGRQLAETTEERSRRLIDPARVVLRLLTRDNLGAEQTLTDRLDSLPLMAAALDAHEVASAVYIGYESGDFLLLRHADRVSEEQLAAFEGAESAHYLLQSVSRDPNGRRVGEWRLYDASLTMVSRRILPHYDFDPRDRSWYRQALTTVDESLTQPYVFFTTGEIGISMSLRDQTHRAVVGIDASLADLNEEVSAIKHTPNERLAVVSDRDRVLAHSEMGHLIVDSAEGPRLATLQELGDPVLTRVKDIAEDDDPQHFTIDGSAWIGMRLPFHAMGDIRSYLLLAVPESEVLAGTRHILWQTATMAGGLVLMLLPVGFWVGRRIGRSLHALADQVKSLANFQFTDFTGTRSRIREVHQLNQAVENMAGNIADFQRINRTLGAERRLDALLPDILDGLLRITDSRHGAIYLIDEADISRFLLAAEAGRDDATPLPRRLDLPATMDDGLAALADEFEPRGYLVQPLRNRSGHCQGLLLLALRVSKASLDDQPWRFFVEEISSAAAVAIEMRRLLEGEKRLLDAIVELVAGAIDAKSMHTGGHCSRVPQLAEMLLEGAHRAQEGPFAHETVDDDRRTTFHLAAWLHDCGKLTTPDEVMEKATKLETRYNRIHEVRTRFEVLWRDADIAYWQGCAEGGDAHALAEARDRRRDELQAAFRLVAEVNRGGEWLDESRIEQLEEVAQWRWWRHFDDRLGISKKEAERMAMEPEVTLPVEEPLLADRPRHLIPWVLRKPPVAPEDPDNRWGFDMRAPDVAGHLGELYNLRVRRGTLNDVERFRIQEHIVQTIIMLNSLPWPSHLRRVPTIAGNHHERMDGEGYPRRLALAEASLEERILAVADIFEALTAADRPYKAAMSMSQSLSILADMVREGHLDSEVFLLLLDSGIWREYAERFLKPDQIDHVDVAELKAQAGMLDL